MTSEENNEVDRGALEARVSEVSRLLNVHAGSLELVDVSSDGVARVRYTGMCAGCLKRPITSAWLVRPGLLEIDGVEEVEVMGSRISAEAEARMLRYMGPTIPMATGGEAPPAWGANG